MRVFFTILFIVILVHPVSGYTYNLPYQSLDGNVQNLDEFDQNYLLFEIMTTWCDICKLEMEELKEVYTSIIGQMELITIGTDLSTDTFSSLKAYKENYKANWTFGLDHEQVFLSTFNVVNFPVIVFLGENGNLINKWEGFTRSTVILDEISKYLPIDYDRDEDDLDFIDDLIERSLIVPILVFLGVFIISSLSYQTVVRLNKNKQEV